MPQVQKQTVSQFELSNLIRKSKLFSKIKLTAASRLVLESLVYHYPNIRVYVETLQEETGCSRRTVDNALSELRDKGLILTTQTGRSSIFALTQRFFDLLEIAQPGRRNQQSRSAISALPQNIHEKKNFKQAALKFKPDGPTYPKYQPEPKRKESPLELDREGAEEFLRNLPQRMQGSFFATELRKKWNFEAIKNPLCVAAGVCYSKYDE